MAAASGTTGAARIVPVTLPAGIGRTCGTGPARRLLSAVMGTP